MPKTIKRCKQFQLETKNNLKKIKGVYKNLSTGYSATITSETIGKILRPNPRVDWNSSKYNSNLYIANYLPVLFEKAIYVDTLAPMKNKKANSNELGYHHFVAPISINGIHYRIIITARQKKNSDVLYVVSIESVLFHPNIYQNDYKDTYDISYRISIKELMENIKIWNYDLEDYLIYTIEDFVCSNTSNYNNYFITSDIFILQ